MLGFNENVDLKELDPMIEFEEIVNRGKLSEIEKDGSFVAGIECDLTLPPKLVGKQFGDGEFLYIPKLVGKQIYAQVFYQGKGYS